VQDLEITLSGGPDVIRLQVPVHDVVGMGEVERLSEGPEDQANFFQRQAAALSDHVAKGLPGDVFKDNERFPFLETGVKYRGDSRVGKVSPDPRLPDKCVP